MLTGFQSVASDRSKVSWLRPVRFDGDFGRDNSAYDRYYGDLAVHSNPCLGPLEKGPFTAFKVVTGDLSTKGGVVTDADARTALPSTGSTQRATTQPPSWEDLPRPRSTIGPAVVCDLHGLGRGHAWPTEPGGKSHPSLTSTQKFHSSLVPAVPTAATSAAGHPPFDCRIPLASASNE
ncbi:FAD-binding protein [Arthrobacter sp. Z4-13]